MIDYNNAIIIARAYLSSLHSEKELSLVEEETMATSFGWVFFYNSKEYLQTGNLSSALLGNAPFIIDKDNGSIFPTGTAYPIEHYIELYIQQKKLGF